MAKGREVKYNWRIWELLPAMESERVEKDVRANGTVEMLADLGWFGEFSFKGLRGHGWGGKGEKRIYLKNLL